MFGKEKNPPKIEQVIPPEPQPAAKAPEVMEPTQGNTVIANDVSFEGNINASGLIYIHGKVFGNVESTSGMVKIMRNGYVEGNIIAKEVVIDGAVLGQCHADIIDIQEHGKVTGSIVYQTLAIKRGGEFSGQAEIRKVAASAVNNNVIDISGDKAAESDIMDDEESIILGEALN